jgi:Flp pilus assembly protein TadG
MTRFGLSRYDRRPEGQRAQGVVELALALPILLLLIMGIVDLGMALRSYVTVTNASREGARYAIVCPATDDLIKSRVVEYASPAVKQNNDVTVTWVNQPGERCKSGLPVEVKAFSDYTYVTPLLTLILPNPLRLSTKTTMRVE